MTTQSRPARIPELDGLRGTAILLVMLLHYSWFTGSAPAHLFYRCFSLGWSGVDLFFVLSGFLIGGILLDVRESPSYFRTFYARRFFRIIPIYYGWVFLYLLLAIAGHFLFAHPGGGIGQSAAVLVVIHLLFLQNIFYGLHSPLSHWWFKHTWSLAVEEQFYLFAPLLVRFLTRRVLVRVLVAIVCLAPFLRLLVRHLTEASELPHWLAYTLTSCRADTLALGVLAAVLWRAPKFHSWAARNTHLLFGGFFALLGGVIVIWIWAYDMLAFATQTVGYTILALFYTSALLLALLRPSSPIARWSRLPWLRELGLVSYCIYIIHRAIQALAFKLLLHKQPSLFSWRDAAVTMLAFCATYGIAKLSWLFFERPLMRTGHTFKYEVASGTSAPLLEDRALNSNLPSGGQALKV